MSEPDRDVERDDPSSDDAASAGSTAKSARSGSKHSSPARAMPPTFGQQLWGWTRELAVVVVLGLIVSTLLRTFVFQMFEIPSGSMENTLLIGDRVAVQKVVPFQRGDIVVFADPGGWLPPAPPQQRTKLATAAEFIGLLPNSSDQYLIKRVIGTEGDVVQCCDEQGRLMVNGQPLDETAYLFSSNGLTVQPSTVQFKVVVPVGRIFVMGDHRNASADSRCHLNDISNNGEPTGTNAFVPVGQVVGVAVAVTWPANRIHLLSRPATFATVPDPTAPAPEQATIEPEGVNCV